MRLAVVALCAASAYSQTVSASASNTLTPSSSPVVSNIAVTSLGLVGASGLFRTGTVLGGSSASGMPPQVWAFTVAPGFGFSVNVVSLGSAAVMGGVGYVAPTNLAPVSVAFQRAVSSATLTVSPTDPNIGGTWYIILQGSAFPQANSYNLTVSLYSAPTPQPSPGYVTIITALNSPITFANLVVGQYILYSITVPLASIPLGINFRLQPTSTTDADLFVTNISPVGTAFTSQLNSELGTGLLDQVTINSASPYWLTGTTVTYYIKVLAYLTSTYTLNVIAVPPTPSPLPAVATSAPAGNSIGSLSLATTPGVQLLLAPGRRNCYEAEADSVVGSLSLSLQAVDVTSPPPLTVFSPTAPLVAGANLVLSVYGSWPPIAANIVAGGDAAVPSAGRFAFVNSSLPWWLGVSGEYFVCVTADAANAAPVLYRLVTTPTQSQASPAALPLVITPLLADTPQTGFIPYAGGWAYYRFVAPAPGTAWMRVNPLQLVTSAVPSAFDSTGENAWATSYSARLEGGTLYMTAGANERGYAYINNLRQIGSSFKFTFDFKVFPGSGYGDGLCFVMHTDPMGVRAFGGVSNHMGLAADSTSLGITNSIAVCVDTYNNNGLPFSTYVMVNGNLTCATSPYQLTGCAYDLPDITLNSAQYSLSLELDANPSTPLANALWWDLMDSGSGAILGSWMAPIPYAASIVGAYANVGFSASTGGSWEVFQVLTYDFATRDRVLLAATGGDSSVYLGLQAPTSPTFYSSYVDRSITTGGGFVSVPVTAPYYQGANGTYYVGIYCDGPAGCAYSVDAHIGATIASPSTSPGPRPSLTATRTSTQTLQPANPQRSMIALTHSVALNGATYSGVMPASASTYFAYTVGVYGPIGIYVTGLGAVLNGNSTPNFDVQVSRVAPVCTLYVNTSDSPSSCQWGYDRTANNPDATAVDGINIAVGASDYVSVNSPLYIRVMNTATRPGFGYTNAGVFLLTVSVPDAGAPGSPAASSGLSMTIIGIIIGVIVLVAVLGLAAFATIVLGKKYGSRAQVITVMTSSQPQEEVAKSPYTPRGVPSQFGGEEADEEDASLRRGRSVGGSRVSQNPLSGVTTPGRAGYAPQPAR